MKGHVVERSPGHHAIVLDVRDPTTGKRKRRWHSFVGTKRQADTECARLIAAMQGGTYLDPNKITLAEFLGLWLEHMRSQVAPRTLERYSELCLKNIVPLLGAVKLIKLQPAGIAAAWTKALASGHRRAARGLSPRTVAHMHTVLKGALGDAIRWRVLTINPADAVDPPRIERGTMTTYDMGQTATLIEALQGNRMLAPVMLAALCGLRRSEICALRWGQVDFAGGQLAISHSAEQTRAGIRYKPPKNGRSRTVALTGTMIEELQSLRVRQAEELLRLGTRQTVDTFVCSLEDGTALRPNTLTIYWARLVSTLTLPRIRFHDLRHACATHMLALGIHPKIASERLGHTRIAITLDLYSHVIPGMQADAAARVDQALKAAIEGRKKGVG